MFTKEMFLNPFIDLWGGLVATLPKLIVALVVFIIGWIIAKIIYKAIVKLGKALRVDDAVRPMAGAIERAGYKLKIGKSIGFLAKWFVIIATLIVSLDILGLQTTKGLLIGIIAYIPQVIIAIFVLMAGVVVASFVKKLIKGSTKMLNIRSAAFLGNLSRLAIVTFTALVSLNVIGFNSEIINVMFTGAVAMIALAGGLAFGLGGRDAAANFIDDMKNSMHR